MRLNVFSRDRQTILSVACVESADEARGRCVRYQLERESCCKLSVTQSNPDLSATPQSAEIGD